MARGSIIKRSSGNYAIVYYVDGKQRWETIGPSRREAERALTARKREVDTGAWREPSSETLASYAERWLAHRDPTRVSGGRTRLSPSTFEGYRLNLRGHVLPRLGERALSSLRTEDVDRLIADLDFVGKEIPVSQTDAIRRALIELAPNDPIRRAPAVHRWTTGRDAADPSRREGRPTRSTSSPRRRAKVDLMTSCARPQTRFSPARVTFTNGRPVQRPGRHRLKLAKSGADVRTYEARPARRVWWPTSPCDWRPDCCSGHSRAWSGRYTFHRANDPSRPRGYLLRRKPRQGPLVPLRPAEPGTRQRPLPGGHSLTLAQARLRPPQAWTTSVLWPAASPLRSRSSHSP